MLKIKIGDNTKKTTVIVDPATPVKQVFKDNGFDLNGASIMLDGLALSTSEAGKTLTEVGAVEGSSLMAVVKTGNAAR